MNDFLRMETNVPLIAMLAGTLCMDAVFKRSDGSVDAVPVNPLGPGTVEDTYTDRLDAMACCKGDYGLYSR